VAFFAAGLVVAIRDQPARAPLVAALRLRLAAGATTSGAAAARRRGVAAFFEGDEFVTLLTLMLEQIQTTHDRKKLKMLATGLANSANAEFTAEGRKELFFRIIRDLAPHDLDEQPSFDFLEADLKLVSDLAAGKVL